MSLRAAIFDSNEAFSTLKAPWSALAARAPDVTVFSSWEWQSIWWKHYGAGHQLRLLTVWDEERLLGLLPLYVARVPVAPGVMQRQVRLVGSGGDTSPDYLGALVDPDEYSRVTPALIELLLGHRRDWDTLGFTDMASGPFTAALENSLQGNVASLEAKDAERIQIARLPASWEEHLAAMHPDRRKRFRYLRKRAGEKLGAKFRVCMDAAELPDALDNLIRLHRKRWNSKDANDGSFRTTSYIEFHREVIDVCGRNGWIRLYCIDAPAQAGDAAAPADGGTGTPASDPAAAPASPSAAGVDATNNTLAAFYCYQYRSEVLYFQSGFDPDFERYSVGQVLLGYALESAVGEGARVFDMLKGEHAYKNSWSNDSRTTREITACRATVPGLLVLGRKRLRKLLRALLNKKPALTGPDGQELPEPAAQEPAVVVGKGAQRRSEGEESH